MIMYHDDVAVNLQTGEQVTPQCPITVLETFRALLEGKFRELNETELDAFVGIEYDGYIWDDPNDDCIVVADHGPRGIVFNVISCKANSDGGWLLEIGAEEFEKI